MCKQKRNVLAVILCILILILTFSAIFVLQKDMPDKEHESKIVSTDVPATINIDNIEAEEKKDESKPTESKAESSFIMPDETEADKILEKNKNNNVSSSSVSKPVVSDTTKNDNVEETASVQTFDKEKKELENTAKEYLKKNNIDPKTAGETGELCSHCSKKIWNPDKYGFFIPGMPEDYENSGYCLGSCALLLE